jgi:hypothetical protein
MRRCGRLVKVPGPFLPKIPSRASRTSWRGCDPDPSGARRRLIPVLSGAPIRPARRSGQSAIRSQWQSLPGRSPLGSQVDHDGDEPRVAVRYSAEHIATREIQRIAQGSLCTAWSIYGLFLFSFFLERQQWVMSARNGPNFDESLRLRGSGVENRDGAVRAPGGDTPPIQSRPFRSRQCQH